MIDATGTYFIQVDHLNTPRLVADAAGTTVWKWDQQEPFGDNVADENPIGLGVFDLPLRLPGQRYDAETGLHYNYYRDYDPSLGIYKQSDPIGLFGGLNTYAYVYGNPLSNSDPTGEFVAPAVAVAATAIVTIGAFIIINQAAQRAQQAAASSATSSSGTSGSCKPDDKGECEQLLRIDTDTCNGITRKRGRRAGEICHASAAQRYAECLRFGLAGVRTPLATWNN